MDIFNWDNTSVPEILAAESLALLKSYCYSVSISYNPYILLKAFHSPSIHTATPSLTQRGSDPIPPFPWQMQTCFDAFLPTTASCLTGSARCLSQRRTPRWRPSPPCRRPSRRARVQIPILLQFVCSRVCSDREL